MENTPQTIDRAPIEAGDIVRFIHGPYSPANDHVVERIRADGLLELEDRPGESFMVERFRKVGRLTLRHKAKRETRRKALEAAKHLFERDGYETATIRDIAREMRMSTGAFFSSFKGKAEVYREIYGHPPITPELGRALMRAAEGVLKGNTPMKDLREVVEAARRGEAHDA